MLLKIDAFYEITWAGRIVNYVFYLTCVSGCAVHETSDTVREVILLCLCWYSEYCTINKKHDIMKKLFLFLVTLGSLQAIGQTYHINTMAGTGTSGSSGDGGPATAANIYASRGVVADKYGNIYMTQESNHTVRRIDTNGVITTFAGTGVSGYSGDGGAATAARLNSPMDIAADGAGNVYVADYINKIIRKITPGGTISTFAGMPGVSGTSGNGGPATAARLSSAIGVTCDATGNVYIGDGTSLRKVDTAGIISFVATIPFCLDLTADNAGNVYSMDASSGTITRITASGVVSNYAGTGGLGSNGNEGPATAAEFAYIGGIGADGAGNLFVSEMGSSTVRVIDTSGIVHAFVGRSYFDGTYHYFPGFSGDNGPALTAQISSPGAVAVDHKGNVYISDWNNVRIRKAYFFNWAPSFIHSDTAQFSVCRNSGANDLDALLSVFDRDTADAITWSVVAGPSHGILALPVSDSSNGDTLLSSGATYTPATNYIGTDTISIAVFDGAEYDTIVIPIVVNNWPSSIGGTLSVCQGSSTTLYNLVSGGIWSSSTPAVGTVDASGVVSGVSAGTTTISYTNAAGCSRTAVVTINPLPAAISGTQLVCVGNTVSLMYAPSGTWSSANSSVASVSSSGVVTGIAAGITTVSYTNSYGCSRTLSVTVNGSVASNTGGASALCVGVTTDFNNATTGGTWYSSNTARATVNASTGLVTGVSSGVVNISYRTSTGCYRVSTLTINPLPNAGTISGVGSAYIGTKDTLTASVGGGAWASSNASVATVSAYGSNKGIVTGVSAGTATITYTVINSCGTAFTNKVVTIFALKPGREAGEFTRVMTLYPNPTKGVFSVIAPVSGKLGLYAIDGREVYVSDVEAGTTSISMPVSAGSGVYLCRFSGVDGSTSVIRLVYAE